MPMYLPGSHLGSPPRRGRTHAEPQPHRGPCPLVRLWLLPLTETPATGSPYLSAFSGSDAEGPAPARSLEPRRVPLSCRPTFLLRLPFLLGRHLLKAEDADLDASEPSPTIPPETF